MRQFLLLFSCLCITDHCFAQGGNPGGGNQGGGGGNNNGQFPGGILIHADGLVDSAVVGFDTTPAALRQLRDAAKKQTAGSRPQPETSAARHISLMRLQNALQQCVDGGTEISRELRSLAGLTRIDFIYLTESRDDVILVGPAEPFAMAKSGRHQGIESGRAVLQLDDLLVVLRDPDVVDKAGCSIDPDPDRLRASQAWLQQNSGPATAAVAKARFQEMISRLGRWNVTTFGVPEDSRMCLTMVEADYIMKRMAIGLDNPGVRGYRSYFALIGPGENMMKRWWFAPHYTEISRNAEASAWKLNGPRIRLFAQEEIMDQTGNLIDANMGKASAEEFAGRFNKHMDQIVQKVAAFSDLQNIFDLLLLAALIRDQQDKGRLSLQTSVLMDSERLPVSQYRVPKETPSLLNVKSSRGSMVLAAFTGGVHFRPALVERSIREATDADAQTLESTPALPDDPSIWWWD